MSSVEWGGGWMVKDEWTEQLMSSRGHVQGRSMPSCRPVVLSSSPPLPPVSCRRLSSEGEGVQRQNRTGVKPLHSKKEEKMNTSYSSNVAAEVHELGEAVSE